MRSIDESLLARVTGGGNDGVLDPKTAYDAMADLFTHGNPGFQASAVAGGSEVRATARNGTGLVCTNKPGSDPAYACTTFRPDWMGHGDDPGFAR